MDIISPRATATATTGCVKTPETESEAPSRIIQPIKPLTFTNGVLKRRHHTHLTPPPAAAVTYKECLKNHAAGLGGHAVDGCGEFMPSPNATPGDPTSLKCAACGCHRNFHRRDPDEPPHPTSSSAHQQVIEYQPHHRHHPPPPPRGGDSSPNSPSPPPISSTYYPSAPHMLLALSSGGLSGNPPEYNPSQTTSAPTPSNPSCRKRFRTKFTANQKEKMHEIAEKLGWKFQKKDEETISELCNDLGIDRGVFKVWMHNNKAAFGKKEINSTTNVSINHSIDNTATTDHHHHHENMDHVVVTNGSSSSS